MELRLRSGSFCGFSKHLIGDTILGVLFMNEQMAKRSSSSALSSDKMLYNGFFKLLVSNIQSNTPTNRSFSSFVFSGFDLGTTFTVT